MNEQQQFWAERYASDYIQKNSEFNPTPTMIEYRGEKDRLIKADFWKDFYGKFPGQTGGLRFPLGAPL